MDLWSGAFTELRHVSAVTALSFSPDGEQLLISNMEGDLALWQARTSEKVCDLGTPNEREMPWR